MRKERGFSLIEMMVVLAIMLVIAAYAVPNISAAIGNVQLRGAGAEIASLVQQTRILAAKQNRTFTMRSCNYDAPTHSCTTGAMIVYYVDTYPLGSPKNGDSTWENNSVAQEPAVEDTSNVVLASGADLADPEPLNFEANSSTLLGYTQPISDTSSGFQLSFNPRGLPCAYASSTATVCTTSGFLYFFWRAAPVTTSKQWIALTVTPAGRVREWSWDGSKWN